MAEDWVSLREFGRRHALSLAAVQKAIETERITAVKRGHGGRLSGVEANAAWLQYNANTDPAEAAKNGKTLDEGIPPAENGAPGMPGQGVAPALGPERELGLPEAKEPPAGQPAGGTAVTSKDPHGYQAARAERERLEVQQRNLDLAKAIGLVISTEEQRRVSARRYRAIRDQLLNIPDRICAALAAERDPAQVHALLTTELKQVLHELSNDASAEVARGLAERVAA